MQNDISRQWAFLTPFVPGTTLLSVPCKVQNRYPSATTTTKIGPSTRHFFRPRSAMIASAQ